MSDQTIVRAAIHPAIGIARIGNSTECNGYFIGPEVPSQPALPLGAYKDPAGALLRQVARFRLFGYNAAGEIVAELNASNAEITWSVELANKKAAWYQFHLALDIPVALEPTTPPSARRNATIGDRSQLAITPGSRAITGCNTQGQQYHFEGGQFFDLPVPLGELRTDAQGNLLVFGGQGLSQSISGAQPTTFANNDGWHDDTSDGPVDAQVTLNGRDIPVEGAWVVVAPPNYAPSLNTVRTMYDLLYDRMVAWGLLPAPTVVSFEQHIRPIFERLSGLQWVNQGFAAWFGTGTPFDVAELLPRLQDKSDANAEFRQRLWTQFRNPVPTGQNLGKTLWPQFYGDGLDGMTGATPDSSKKVVDGLSALSELQLSWLQSWAKGEFDDSPAAPQWTHIDQVPVPQRPALLDQAALEFCLADAFHPGCEMTWPMRIPFLYAGPYRIKRRTTPEPDFGLVLTPAEAIAPDGPMNGAAAGDLTRWMAVPWQTDTASCLSGYTFFNTSPSLPTFWPARVPNQVLSLSDYKIVMDPSKTKEERLSAFAQRLYWFRTIGVTSPQEQQKQIERMIKEFDVLGIVEERDGPTDLPGVPSRIWVESEVDVPADLAAQADQAEQVSRAFSKLRRLGQYGR
ncbi:MAG: LodA/GoxA family CTQ-dependent oxidase [Cyanobacteria bacterium P01_G01_bin.54]